ncbi:MAG: ABC transporter permease [Acidobacteria bacterium]|nr:ABC transporter permease [Acidobacteriota bacterium]
MNRNQPSRHRILGRLVSPAVRQAVIEDFEEQRQYLAEREGRLAAAGWYWFQVAGLAGERLRSAFTASPGMLANYLRVAVRSLRKNKVHSLLNVIGLTTGLATFILIALYVQFELSFDRYHAQADRIYRVVRDEYCFSPPPLGPRVRDQFPAVASAARVMRDSDVLVSRGDRHIIEQELYWADPAVLDIFTIPFRQGDPRRALATPDALVLSESTARKYFGGENPLGQSLTLFDRQKFVVTGVFADMPANSHLHMGMMAPLDTWFRSTGSDSAAWSSNYVYTYLLLRPDADPQAVQDGFLDMEKEVMTGLGADVPPGYERTYGIQPITEIHLHSHRQQEVSPNNDMAYILLISAIAVLVLLIACVNYMNLATARSLPRSREVGLRKVVGARRGQLVAQFLGESVTIILLALGLSLVVAWLALPWFNTLVERELRFDPTANPLLFGGILLVSLLTGLLAGIYPAFFLSGFRPAAVLNRTFTGGSRPASRTRNILVLAQFAVTIVLISSTFVVRDQLHFMRQADLGYSQEQIVVLPIRDRAIRQNLDSIRTELLRRTDITAVALSDSLPNSITNFTRRDWTGKSEGEPVPIYYNTTGYDFVDLFDIEVVRGRNFSREFPADAAGAFLVNETAVRTAGWDDPLEREFVHWRGDRGKIVGVVKDFHFQSLHQPIAPLYIFLDPGTASHLSVKIRSTDVSATLAAIEKEFRRFSPNWPFEYTFFDETFARAYQDEQRLETVFGVFAGLAVVIAALGLFGLAVFSAEQRSREMGIRKVLGASPVGIALLLSREFLAWVLVANVIAWPAAWFLMDRWLDAYAYRVEPGAAPFAASALLAVVIAALTVSVQALRAAMANPVDSLRRQ